MTTDKIIKDRIQLFTKLFKEKRLMHLESNELLKLANRFLKIENKFKEIHNLQLISKKIAIVSSSTSHFFLQILRLFSYQEGIAPIFYEAEYGSIYEQILNEKYYNWFLDNSKKNSNSH